MTFNPQLRAMVRDARSPDFKVLLADLAATPVGSVVDTDELAHRLGLDLTFTSFALELLHDAGFLLPAACFHRDTQALGLSLASPAAQLNGNGQDAHV